VCNSRPPTRDGDEEEWVATHAADVRYGEPCDRDHRAAPEAPARSSSAFDFDLSLLDEQDGVGQLVRLRAELEPGRNPEEAPGEPRAERAAKERLAGALVDGHRSVSGRPNAGKSSG